MKKKMKKMEIKILGTGCPNCLKQEKNVRDAVEKLGVEVNISKVSKIEKIMEYRVMSMPAIVINENVVGYGRIFAVDEVIDFIEKNG